MRVLVVNPGSSTLKVRLLGPADEVLADRVVDPWDGGRVALSEEFLAADAVGYRVVHGGTDFHGAVSLDDSVLARIEALAPLAPLHQPRAVAAVRAVGTAVLHGTPAVACFDTAFHATLPAAAATYALPGEWRQRWGLRRFGFHGLSHAYASRCAAPARRVVSCHLGAGASLCAVLDGRSVDTTMGFTPLDGLVMATRSGAVDPGLVVWLVVHAGMDPAAVGDGLERASGLAGLSGTSGDMRDVLARSASSLAFDVYIHRLRREIAAMAAALGGLDTLVFTGGVGEHLPVVRASAADGLGFLGVVIDGARNATTMADGDIAAAGAAVRTLVVTAREDIEIARQVRAVLVK